jgi:hypothetical protein
MKRPYTGRFDPAKVKAILDAASPIPASRFRYRDGAKVRTCARADAVIHRLEWIAAAGGLTKNDLAPSTLAKNLHAIAAAAGELAKLLPYNAERGQLPPQLQNALWAMADDEGEPDPDSRLQEIIEGIIQLRTWSETAEKITRQAVGAGGNDVVARSGMEQDDSDPINEAIAGILEIWSKILERPVKSPPYSSCSEEAYGALIDFTLACLQALELGDGLGPGAVRGRIRRMMKARTQRIS